MIAFWIVCFAASFLNKSIQEDVWYKYNMGQYTNLALYLGFLFAFSPFYAFGFVLKLLGDIEHLPKLKD